MDFGTDIVFSYGPLGFLRYPLVIYGGAGVLSAVYTLLLQYGLAVTFLWGARRSFPLLVALPVAYFASALNSVDAIVPVAFVWALAALDRGPPDAGHHALIVFGGRR
jgi:hypothetical protein